MVDGQPGVPGVNVLKLVDTGLNTENDTVIIPAQGMEESRALE